MPRKKSPILTDHELRLMEVLWRTGQATIAEVVEGIDPPALAYNTVLTTMRTLEQKRYVTHAKDGRAFIYRPLITQKDAARSATRHVLNRFFGNSPEALALALLDDTRLSDADAERVRQILSRQRKASK